MPVYMTFELVGRDVIKDVLINFDKAPKTMKTFIEGTIKKDIEDNALTQLRAPQPKPPSPMRWRSKNQRIFVMIKLRRAKNLPYRRTGKLQAGWFSTTKMEKNRAEISISHPSKIVDYVSGSGPDRQPMFPQWYYHDDILLRQYERTENMIIDVWYTVLINGKTFA